MYEGYLRVGAVEVVNAARAKAYTEAGCRPPETLVDVPVPCDGLGEALGDGTYRLPALDDAPWFEPENPDTHWFGGVIPLDVTGLDGSTFQAGSAEGIGDGGVVTLARRGLRTVAVSALLVGRDAASVHAGLEWLTTVLTRTCGEEDPSCSGTTLEAFTTCPAPPGDVENLDAAFVDTVVNPDGEWFTQDGSWDHAGRFTVADDTVFLDAGGPGTEDSDVLDGGTPATDYTTWGVLDGGGVYPLTGFGLLAAPTFFDCTLSEVHVTWSITPVGAEDVRVKFAQVNDQGQVIDEDPGYIIAATSDTLTVTEVYDARFDGWAPAVWIEAPGADVTLTVSTRPYLTADECLTPFRRTYTNVSLVAGPTVAASHAVDDDSDARLLQVEWTWVCGDPYRYTQPVTLVAGLVTDNTAPVILADGAAVEFISPVDNSTPCAPPTTPPGLCARDPDYPTFVPPPEVPTITDPAIPDVAAYSRRVLELQPSLIPRSGVGALVLTLENTTTDAPGGDLSLRGTRVRIWGSTTAETMFDGFGECDFDEEIFITYIPGGGIVTIDSTAMSVTVICANGRVFDGKHLMRGPYGGAFVFPTLSCDRRYWLAFDNPNVNNHLVAAAALAVREG